MGAEKEVCEKKGVDGAAMLISFLVGAAAGVGVILYAEAKAKEKKDTSYGDADLFV
jgi:hypothetical protein